MAEILYGLNFHFYLVTLQTNFHKTVSQAQADLLELGGNRAVLGVDNDSPQPVIHHPGMLCQPGRDGCREALLQPHEEPGVGQDLGGLV